MAILISICVYLAETVAFGAKHIYLTEEKKKKISMKDTIDYTESIL